MPYERLYWDYIKSRVKNISESIQEDEKISFIRLNLSIITGIDVNEADEYITDGTEDLGSDAVYFDIDDDEKKFDLHIIQSKYNREICEQGIFNQNLGEEVINKFKNVFDFFSCNLSYPGVNEDLIGKKTEYDELISRGYSLNRVIFTSCNLGLPPAENSLGILNRWLENHPLRDKIEYTHLGLKEIFMKVESLETPAVSDSISLYGRYFEYLTPEFRGLIGTITANELLRLFNRFGDKLFQQNVRYYLGDNNVNKKIIKSASEVSSKDKFWFLNNGITIVCQNYFISNLSPENPILRVENFQIANGAQTTKALSKALEVVGNLNDVRILVKINKADSSLSDLITEATNNQNPINKRDLRSNDEIQKLLERNLSTLGYFFQRKRNQFSDKPKEKVIDNLILSQIYYSFYLNKPHIARNQRGKLFSDDTRYLEIFNTQITPDKIIFLHKLYLRVLTSIRQFKREGEIPNEILLRSKLFLMYSLKVYFEKNGKNLNDIQFLQDPTNSEDINIEIIKKILFLIKETVIEMVAQDQNLNNVRAFQREELTTKLQDILNREVP